MPIFFCNVCQLFLGFPEVTFLSSTLPLSEQAEVSNFKTANGVGLNLRILIFKNIDMSKSGLILNQNQVTKTSHKQHRLRNIV